MIPRVEIVDGVPTLTFVEPGAPAVTGTVRVTEADGTPTPRHEIERMLAEVVAEEVYGAAVDSDGMGV